MAVKQHINHGAIQKVCHLHNGIFHSMNLCHTFSISSLLSQSPIYSITSFVLFSKNNKLWNERKEEFLYIWLLQRITLIKGGRKSCL